MLLNLEQNQAPFSTGKAHLQLLQLISTGAPAWQISDAKQNLHAK
jgi:hypothetical protein